MIKKILINFFIISCIVALYITNYKSFIEIKSVFPDLLLILTALNGIFNNAVFAMFFGFFAGLSLDISSYHLLGFYSIIYSVIGYITSITKVFNINNTISTSVFIFILLLIKAFLFFILGIFCLEKEIIFIYFKDKFLIEIIYTVLISIPVFLLYKKLYSKKRK